MNLSKRMHSRNEQPNSAATMGITLFLMYLVSAVFLLVLAFLLYKMNLSESIVKMGTIVTYVASCFLGGFFIGKKMRDKRYLWGLLAGSIYFILLFFLSLLLKQGMGEEGILEPVRIVTALVLCAVSGMAGGMVS